ncbi:hypothetical protein FACS189432_00260 [Bacteroidia bacterium]|nr:hypothetical protein FACS189426_01800 [Bacteroidia bacterium]GHT26243.1 hypothetical protein FACS189432_00260 [Bacteroidia bacterium]
MKIKTVRNIKDWPYMDLVYEWEDQFHKELDAPFIDIHKYDRYINKMISIINWNIFSLFPSSTLEFLWQIDAQTKNNRHNRSNILPAIIDFHLSQDKLNNFYHAYSNNPCILISNLEVFNFLKNNSCPRIIHHFPLSLPDKYKITPTTKFEKEYDLLLVGRTNPVLNDYLKKYIEKHKDFTYVYESKKIILDYYTSKGKYIGQINTRKGYIDLIRKSKIALYSTPGIDGGESRTKGFNQVTPKFLEFLASGCHVIARYKQNPDTDYYQLEKFCSNINTYDEFEREMDKARNSKVDMKKYSEYLEDHYTSKRIELFKTILKEENIAWKK